VAKTGMKKGARKRLSPQERKFLAARTRGLNLKDSALAAGYTAKSPRAAGHRANAQLAAKVPDLFERCGLDDEIFVNNCILPALRATETKCVQNPRHGKNQPAFIYSKAMVAWQPRVATNRLVAEMKGLIKGDQENTAPSVRVLIIDASKRPPRRPQTEPGLPAIDLPPPQESV
jgi:hypothetical protein